MSRTIKSKIRWIVMSVAIAAPQSAWACAACSGRSDDAMAHGLNAALLTLLVVLLMVLGCLASFMVNLIRRETKYSVAVLGVSGGSVK